MTHGRSGYERHGCRCAVCRAANTAKVAATRARRLARLRASPVPESDDGHGTHGGYDAGCRCEACRFVRQSRYWREEGGPRPHRWREMVCETYREARWAWEAAYEAYCNQTWTPQHASREWRKSRRGGRREHTDFIEENPPPTLRAFLVGMAGTMTPQTSF